MEIAPYFTRFLLEIPQTLADNESFINDLQCCTRLVTVKKGEYLIRMGELCQDGYFINKGLFINQYINANGNICVTGFSAECVCPFVSTLGYFTQVPSEFEIKALEDGELLCFSRADIERLSFNYPLFASCYQNVMLMIISKLYTMFAVRQTCTAEEFLLYLYKNHQWLVSRVPDKYIAQYMGITNAWYCKLKKRILY